jgi:hypothetical protein
MKVRALQTTYIDGTYRKGPEMNDKEEVVAIGETFDVADDFLVHPEVLEVVTPPASGKPRLLIKQRGEDGVDRWVQPGAPAKKPEPATK